MRTAISWESDIDGLTFHHYVENSMGKWTSVSTQQVDGEIFTDLSVVRIVGTSALDYCADGAVVIDGSKFMSVEDAMESETADTSSYASNFDPAYLRGQQPSREGAD